MRGCDPGGLPLSGFFCLVERIVSLAMMIAA